MKGTSEKEDVLSSPLSSFASGTISPSHHQSSTRLSRQNRRSMILYVSILINVIFIFKSFVFGDYNYDDIYNYVNVNYAASELNQPSSSTTTATTGGHDDHSHKDGGAACLLVMDDVSRSWQANRRLPLHSQSGRLERIRRSIDTNNLIFLSLVSVCLPPPHLLSLISSLSLSLSLSLSVHI